MKYEPQLCDIPLSEVIPRDKVGSSNGNLADVYPMMSGFDVFSCRQKQMSYLDGIFIS